MLLFAGYEADRSSLAQVVSSRVLGSAYTFLLSRLFSSLVKAARAIARTEVITEMVLYDLHEGPTIRTSWGKMTPVQ